MRFRSIVIFVLAVVVAAGALYLRRRPPAGEHEQGIVLSPTTEPTAPPPPSPMAAPTLAEVPPAVDRVFAQTLVVDRATRPAFVAGDFNGDGVADLAVAVRPRSPDALTRLNAELTSWSMQDATAPAPLTMSKPEPVKVAAADVLLAVIHGEGAGGWRDPQTNQGYLVKNAVGSGMQPLPLAEVPAPIRMRVNRTHVGDVIVEKRGGERGLILWTGATYVWADLGTGGAAKARR